MIRFKNDPYKILEKQKRIFDTNESSGYKPLHALRDGIDILHCRTC